MACSVTICQGRKNVCDVKKKGSKLWSRAKKGSSLTLTQGLNDRPTPVAGLHSARLSWTPAFQFAVCVPLESLWLAPSDVLPARLGKTGVEEKEKTCFSLNVYKSVRRCGGGACVCIKLA